MSTEERLRAALDARAATASPYADAFARVRTRARRRRRATMLQVASAAAAVAVVVAGTALAVDGDRPAPPVASDSPSPTPTPTTSPEPVPSESPLKVPPPPPTPTASFVPHATLPPGTRAVGADEYVAVLDDGRLVIASATTGTISWTVPGNSAGGQVALAADRRSVFVATPHDVSTCDARIDRVDVATGRRIHVAYGRDPDASPDGTRLAYLNGCGNAWLVVRDLRTGAERWFFHYMVAPDDEGNYVLGDNGPWHLDRGVWHADGESLWVGVVWEDVTDLRLLDPATDRRTDDARRVRTAYSTYDLDRSGPDLVYRHSCCYADETGEDLVVVRSPDGTERVVTRIPHATPPFSMAAGPDGDVLYERDGRLYRLDVGTGTSTDLGEANALARDW